MYYFVIGSDEKRYGPADVDMLVQWAREGRLVASTTLVERGTERALRADSLTAVAAALRSSAGESPAVAVERGPISEAPTMTRIPPQPPQALSGAGPPQPPQFIVPGYAPRGMVSHRSKIVAGILGILLGGLGAHRFYLGYTGVGVIQLVLTLASCGIASIWGLVEGIVCLCGGMTDVDGLELRD